MQKKIQRTFKYLQFHFQIHKNTSIIACPKTLSTILPVFPFFFKNFPAKILFPAEDPRAELVQKLLEYKMYKCMSYELKDRQVDAQKVMFKTPTMPCHAAIFDSMRISSNMYS